MKIGFRGAVDYRSYRGSVWAKMDIGYWIDRSRRGRVGRVERVAIHARECRH